MNNTELKLRRLTQKNSVDYCVTQSTKIHSAECLIRPQQMATTSFRFAILSFFLLSILVIWATPSQASQFPFKKTPDWISKNKNHFSTGLALADINNDGWRDIIVANGNDSDNQSVTVYYYDSAKRSFPTKPNWSSGDQSHNAEVSAGDINGDGRIDIAVSVWVGDNWGRSEGYVKVYMNTGTELEKTPSWRSKDSFGTYGLTLADLNHDGKLDLAVAVGNPYTPYIEADIESAKAHKQWQPDKYRGVNYVGQQRIYFNQNGKLQDLPGWKSDESIIGYDIGVGDLDQNGYMDIAIAATESKVYLANDSGDISHTADWSAIPNFFATMLDLGRQSLQNKTHNLWVVSHNDQPNMPTFEPGNGRFTMYANGYFSVYLFPGDTQNSVIPYWESKIPNTGSGVLFADLNRDNCLDLVTAAWGQDIQGSPIDIYQGSCDTNFELSNFPMYSSATSNTITESIAVGDLSLKRITDEKQKQASDYVITEKIDPKLKQQSVIYISAQTPDFILSVEKNDIRLRPYHDYAIAPGKNWISFAEPVTHNDKIKVTYQYSPYQDIVTTSYDSANGNYIFYNTDGNKEQ